MKRCWGGWKKGEKRVKKAKISKGVRKGCFTLDDVLMSSDEDVPAPISIGRRAAGASREPRGEADARGVWQR